MGFRRLAFGLLAVFTLLLLGACQGTSTQPLATATAAPAAAPTLLPRATAVPAAPGTTETPPAKTDAPASSGITQPESTSQPTPTGQAGEPQVPTTQPAQSLPQAQKSVFYQQNGLTLEYYWPLDDQGNLSADETEILAYNESGETIEFTTPKMAFTEDGNPRALYSGAWEKFPSRSSWDRIGYISIPPSPYQGETMLVRPGEKAKLHWHLESIDSANTNQSVAIDLTVTRGVRAETITLTLVRDSGQPDTVVATAPEPTQEPDYSQQSASNDGHTGTEGTTSGVRWSFNGTAWSPNGTPPSCAEPFVLQTPVDMNIVTSALWPGQVRGAYVAHGGFRFDANVDNSVTVLAPIGSHLVQASRYLQGDDVQYLLFFSVPCGFFYRFDHVRVVSPTLADALKDLPAAIAGDSRTTVINPPLWLEQGEIVGTSVGVAPSNIFVDFGLYDVRTPNNVTPNPAWADLYAGDKEFGHYGVCFFDYLSGNDGEKMRSLPTGVEGKTSDYCQ